MQTFYFQIATSQVEESAQFWGDATLASLSDPLLFDCCFWLQPRTHETDD